ncbi:MAG TPA: M23 family metallopeptidase [Candidatus Limnocylindria bacterium]|nr:M23 family metallopeptidase [Candidatus Limnocylindria bacterium]
MRPLRPILAILGVIVFGGIAAYASRPAPAVSAAQSARPAATADAGNVASADPAAGPGRRALDEDRADLRSVIVAGLLLPVESAELPTDAEALPGAPRDYRGGSHEGIDFAAPTGAPVRAVAAGTIIRVDHEFTDWDQAEREAALAEAQALGYTPARTLDRIRGRQVWIAHGRGLVSRYAHLEGVAELAPGQEVAAGTVIGTVGSSGYPEGGPHLHLEIRIGRSYLGEGLSGETLSGTLSAAFGPR